MKRSRALARRISAGLFGASVAGLATALLEGLWAAAKPDAATQAGWFEVALASGGILLPYSLLLGFAVGLGSAWLWPEAAPSVPGWIGALRERGKGRRAAVAALAALAPPAALAWAAAASYAAREILSLSLPPLSAGVAAATAALVLATLFGAFVLACVPPLRRVLATIASSRPGSVDPALSGAAGLAFATLLLTVGVVTGTPSGEGGVLGIFGVLKRGELDLRAPAMLACVAGASLFAAGWWPKLRGWIALPLALVPLALTLRAAHALGAEPEVGLALERGAPLSKHLLRPLRRVMDRDGDGASSAFGGGDCDDSNAAIGPHAAEVLDNGIDEDCSGADLSSEALAKLAPSQETGAPEPTADTPEKLNVVLITIDTLRYDLGFAGYERDVSPNLDALAERGVVFERAYSLASYTGKSIGPMLIGKYGSETHRNWGHFNKFSEEDVFVAERLQDAGILTMAVHGHRYFDVWGGLERGFDVLDMDAAPPKDAPWAKDDRRTSALLTDNAIELVREKHKGDQRFFLWVHYLDPHAAYLPHEEAPDFGRTARGLYDGEVWFTDHHVGRLLDFIRKEHGENTAVIVTSDHGEAFGENGMYMHGFEVWDVLVRVPLLVYVPGVTPHRVEARRSLIDVVPTILDLMKVDKPSGREGDDFLSGTSLVADLFPPADGPPGPRDVFVDMPAGPYNDARRALIHGDDKLIITGESHFELYDLEKDPGESAGLARKEPERLAAMKERYAALKAWLREIKVTGERKH